MKKTIITILIIVLAWSSGYSQDTCKECPGVMLGKTYSAIQRTFEKYPDYLVIERSDTCLSYYNWREDVTKTYVFKRYKGVRYNIASTYTVDCMTGEELIGSHLSDGSWVSVDSNVWSFDTPAYDIPLTVILTYRDGFMVFTYKYIPKRN